MRDSIRYVSVAVPTPLRSTFQYRLKTGQLVSPGDRVVVPFGKRNLVGVVTSIDTQAKLNNQKIRDIIKVLANDIRLTGSILRLCAWAADYYHHPIGDVISSSLPTLIRKGGHPHTPIESLKITSRGSETKSAGLRSSPAQRNLLINLKSHALTMDELKRLGISTRTIRVLVDKGWAVWQSRKRIIPTPFRLYGVNHEDISLSHEQQHAISSTGKTTTYLLQGVTGSGKTEVYFRLIEPVLEAGKQVLFLVPEIGLTPQSISH